jgi:tetratricopeptide (TPR) repeat protein
LESVLGSDYDGALVEYLKALAIQESVLEFVLGTEHQDAANTSNNIGEVLYTKGDYDGALVEYRKALAIHNPSWNPSWEVTTTERW